MRRRARAGAGGRRAYGPRRPWPFRSRCVSRSRDLTRATIGDLRQQHVRHLVEQRVHGGVAALGDAPGPVHLARGVLAWRGVEIGADVLGAGEAGRVVDAGADGEGGYRPTPGTVVNRRHTGVVLARARSFAPIAAIRSTTFARPARPWPRRRPRPPIGRRSPLRRRPRRLNPARGCTPFKGHRRETASPLLKGGEPPHRPFVSPWRFAGLSQRR